VGARVLEQGGNAVDAGVATLLTLGVVNPFASGLGGGGFCLYRPKSGEVEVLDFRERAPLKASRDMYIHEGKADIGQTMRGGLASGVPGEIKGLSTLHAKYGSLAWRDVVEPARAAAVEGFEVGALLPKRLDWVGERMKEFNPSLAAVFERNGAWVKAGDTMKWPALGRLLTELQQDPGRFYRAPIASAIVEAVNEAGGVFSIEDFTAYDVTWRKPLVGTYRGYTVFAMPPPSSGGTAIIEALNFLEHWDLATLGQSAESYHRIVEALKHAFADRARWGGDGDFVDVPVERLISKDYARQLRKRFRHLGVGDIEDYGTAKPPEDPPGTSHMSVVDGDGNVLACTSTVNTSFGSWVYVDEWGLVMNNEMGDFSAQPGVPNNYGLVGTEANAVAPGKRPLSSMSPTIIVDEKGEPFMAVGASGGPTIITGTLFAILHTIDWGSSPSEAISAPRIHHQWLPNKLFVEEMEDWKQEVLRARGHEVVERRAYNSVQMVVRGEKGWTGVSDPRKDGAPAAAKE
jgi:gamma-glutamyltranspeptidase/glutathione hydrolase